MLEYGIQVRRRRTNEWYQLKNPEFDCRVDFITSNLSRAQAELAEYRLWHDERNEYRLVSRESHGWVVVSG